MTDGWDNLRWWGSAIASLVWLAVYVYLASSWGENIVNWVFDLYLAISWLIGTLGLAGFWVVVAVIGIRAWSARNSPRARRAAAFLVPFPAVAAAAILLTAQDLPMRARFELSEASLNRVADDYEGGNRDISGWAGLYHVLSVHRLEDCTVIITGRESIDELGFARCSEPLPEQLPPNVELEKLKGRWWKYTNRDWW